MATPKNMQRLEALVAALPEAERVDVEAWDNAPTFRVRNKNFVFANDAATLLSFKLDKEEAQALVASDDDAQAMGYGLGRHGWVSVRVRQGCSAAKWQEVTECVRTSYTLVAPKKLARLVLEEDGLLDG